MNDKIDYRAWAADFARRNLQRQIEEVQDAINQKRWRAYTNAARFQAEVKIFSKRVEVQA